jgi:ribonucleoside-diphosphate reductase alpha chain
LGCKGLTVYVSGSREEEVLETKSKKESLSSSGKTTDHDINSQTAQEEISGKEDKSNFDYGSEAKLGRPYRLEGATYSVKTPQGKAFITVNKDSSGRPFEIFINVGKAGTDVAALSEGVGRLVSGWLRVPGSSESTVTEIISQLSGIGGSRSVGFGKNRVSSIPDAVAKVLAEEFGYSLPKNLPNGNGSNGLAENTPMNSASEIKEDYPDDKYTEQGFSTSIMGNVDFCPDCGNYSFVKEEGCAKCYLCGYSVC